MRSIISLCSNITRRKANITVSHFAKKCDTTAVFFCFCCTESECECSKVCFESQRSGTAKKLM